MLSVYDQNGNTISDMPDYFMHIQFIIRKVNETKLILNKVLDYNKESYLILGHTFDIINKIYTFINKIVMNYLKKISNV